ncbi:MAG TPA: anhydro-N-acetylmuramic acid kinase [Candidatus Ozemobacteraceae bacterium]|nr:anhydro-N-acetylmuramic acid kinase [Candidatus Ozemobacteraceae bacterium]
MSVMLKTSGKLRILGMMSGTSGDAIDGTLVTFDERDSYKLDWYDSYEFAAPVRQRLQSLMVGITGPDLARAEAYVAELYAEAVRSFRCRHREQIDAIAVHGQTLVHVPTPVEWDGMKVSGTIQALSPSWLAHRCGLPVVSDFRRRDMAAGGQGAPLVPYGDARFFGHLSGNTVALNIGGIANITVLSGGPGAQVVSAFDTGPGNMLMDAAMVWATNGEQCYDRDGAFAASAPYSEALLQELLQTPYLRTAPPKTTGREDFGCTRWEEIKKAWEKQMSAAELVSTFCEFTARSIAEAIVTFVAPTWPPDRVVVAGGGAYNPELCRRIRERLPPCCAFERSDVYGVPVMAREAMAFAALGEAFLRGRPANVPAATGARQPVVLGSYTPA